MTTLNIALMQASDAARTPVQAIEELATQMVDAAALGADVLVTPELYLSGYGNPAETVSRAQAPHSTLLLEASAMARHHGVALVLGYPERTDTAIFNSAIAFGPTGELLCNYRKMNLPNDYERSCFQRGLSPLLFDVAGVRCAVLICYDIEFPELTRQVAEMGADLIIVPTALGPRWRIVSDSLIPVRAYENGLFVAYCNFTSQAQQQLFAGLSTICGPDGQPLLRAETQPGLFKAVIDTDDIRRIRSELQFLPDLALMRLANRTGKNQGNTQI